MWPFEIRTKMFSFQMIFKIQNHSSTKWVWTIWIPTCLVFGSLLCIKIHLNAKWVHGVIEISWQVTTLFKSLKNPATACVTGCDESSSLLAPDSEGLPVWRGCWLKPVATFNILTLDFRFYCTKSSTVGLKLLHLGLDKVQGLHLCAMLLYCIMVQILLWGLCPPSL